MTTSKKLWLCFQCGKRYMWKDSLKKHLRVECGKEPTYECPICGRKFKHKHPPRLTVKNIENLRYKRRPVIHKCTRCGKGYQLETSLRRHQRLECGVEPRQSCPICGKKFTHRHQIRKEIDDDKNFPKKRLLATMLLSQDVQQPQDNNEPLWNQLPYPGIRGYEASRSQRRKDSKDAGSKYACNRCGKTYKATTSLSRHKRLECGVIPCEVCPICDRRFKHRFVLNSHIVGCQRKLRHIIQKTDDSPVFTEERDDECNVECMKVSKSVCRQCALTRNKHLRKNCPLTFGFLSKIDWSTMNDYRNATADDLLPKERNFNDSYYYPCPMTDSSKKQLPHQLQQQQQQQQQLFTCALCGKKYTWMYSLRRHQLQCGNKEARNKRWFFAGKRADLSDWFVKQENEYEVPQTLFEFVASSYELAEAEERKKAAKSVICEECGKSEKSESYSEKDQEDDVEVCEISFHGQLPMNYLLCDSSILNTVETSILRKNVKSHQQFRCDGCDRAYTRMDSLKRHQAKCDASLEKLQEEVEWLHRQKFYCNQCGKGYKRLDTLRRHQRLVCGDKEGATAATDKSTT
ncbi:Zinc finger protein [Apis cerana cerana]|uniref:Zinc finger protein n=1 Tax=Apis cerana cerana TaxID=94128 RepID=A0A2A3ES41_APICC|nr:Zinc finger protein [Apis cerana cerana]